MLDMVSINWLFNKYQDRNPQWLTEHKMAMVSNKFLAALAVVLGFDKHIKARTTSLLLQMSLYAENVCKAIEKDSSRADFWTQIEDPPKALSDVVESYLGAVMVDSGFDYAQAERFFNHQILRFFLDMSMYDNYANRHPTTWLHKKLADEYHCIEGPRILCSEPPKSDVTVQVTAGVLIHDTVMANATADSARYAKPRAAKLALQKLEGMGRAEFRKVYKCTCRKDDD